jgi:hypothetical protein
MVLASKSGITVPVIDTQFATAYSYAMTKREKLIVKALNNPKGL